MRAKKSKNRWTWILFYQGPASNPEGTPDVLMKNLTKWISEEWKFKGEARGNCRQQLPLPDCRNKDGSWHYQNIKAQTRGSAQLNQSSEQGTLLAGAGNSERWWSSWSWGGGDGIWKLQPIVTATDLDEKTEKKKIAGETIKGVGSSQGTLRGSVTESRVQLLTT